MTYFVVGDNGGWGLGVLKFCKNVTKDENLLSVDEKRRKFGLSGRCNDVIDDSGGDMKRALEASGVGRKGEVAACSTSCFGFR